MRQFFYPICSMISVEDNGEFSLFTVDSLPLNESSMADNFKGKGVLCK